MSGRRLPPLRRRWPGPRPRWVRRLKRYMFAVWADDVRERARAARARRTSATTKDTTTTEDTTNDKET